MNENLRVIPDVRHIIKMSNLMEAQEKDFLNVEVKQWVRDGALHVLGILTRSGRIQVNNEHPKEQLEKAIQICRGAQAKYSIYVRNQFRKHPDLASFIKCHIVYDSENQDGFYNTVTEILKEYDVHHDAEEIKKDIGKGTLKLIENFFDYELITKKFDEDISIRLGWDLPLPIHVDWKTPFPDDIITEKDMKEFFECYDVVEL